MGGLVDSIRDLFEGRKRTVVLVGLALAVPLPAFAVTERAIEAVSSSPAALSVSTSLGSCGTLDSQIVCELNVSFEALPEASSYSASVTRADGSVVDYGAVSPGGNSLYVDYVGSGSYSVRVTAYGEPEAPDKPKQVISTEVARAEPERSGGSDSQDEEALETEAAPRGEGAAGDGPGKAELAPTEVTPSCAETPEPAAPDPATPPPTEPPPTEPLPTEPPPTDTDPHDPDEDQDGIPDEQERVEYDAAVAQQESAIAQQEAELGVEAATPPVDDCAAQRK